MIRPGTPTSVNLPKDPSGLREEFSPSLSGSYACGGWIELWVVPSALFAVLNVVFHVHPHL